VTLDTFLRDRQQSWDQLQALLAQASGRPENLGAEGVRRLGTLYREAAADLALARRQFPTDPVRTRLEQLVGRAALLIYEGRSSGTSFWSFVSTGYWRAVASGGRTLALAAVLLLVPAILAGAWAHAHPADAASFIPGDFQGATDPPGDSGAGSGTRAVFSAELFTNNIQVTFLGFALGITAGIGTALVLGFNGLLLGAVAGAAIEAGNGRSFFEFVIPHGPLELTCIIVTAAAGMQMGWAFVDPGGLPRRQALTEQARTSVLVVLGTMPWLVAAGITEAFVRSSGLPSAVLIAVGLGLFLTYWGLVWVRGREPGQAPEPIAPGAPAPQPG